MDSTTTTKVEFESEVCSRCHGSGEHSYCQSHGTRCFKCRGKKRVMTKRGQAAFDYYLSLKSRRVSTLVAGDVIREDTCFGPNGFSPILSIEPESNGTYTITTKSVQNIGVPGDSVREISMDAASKAVILAKAMAYQATLTKQGKPRAR